MKIVCDSCGAKYSIADEKVAGKVFKIRCKKCTEVIVVRGDQPSAGGADDAAASPDVGDGGAEGVWHIVVDGDQQGPMTPAEIGALMSEGRVDWEAYVWREGFDGWKAARDVPELVDAISGGGASADDGAMAAAAPAASAGGFGADMGADPFAGDDAANESPFGASSGSPFGGAAPAAKPAARSAGADLFAAPAASASPFGGGGGEEDDGVVASTPSPRISSGSSPMTGQRNENSVLFSLSNLQALATGAPEKSQAPTFGSPSPAPARATGHATAEGSGLIDIRALAGASSAIAAAPRAASPKASVDDLLSIGAGGGLGGGLAPVLAPVAQEPERGGKNLVVILAAVAAVAIVGLGVTLVVVLTKKDEGPVVMNPPGLVALPAAGATPGAAALPGAAPGTAPSAAAAVPSAEATAPAPAAAAEDPSVPRTARPSGSRSPSTGARRPAGESGGSSAPAASAAPAESTMRAGGSDSIDNLLNSALDRGSRPTPSSSMAAAASGDLADAPSRSDVMSGLNGVAAAVRNCKQGRSGTARARVVFAGDTGRVSSVQVDGDFAGGPENACIERAVRAARVPPFRRSSFNVTFPYRL